MKFEDFADSEEPAFDLFNKCHEIVFDGSDGRTEYLDRVSPEARLVYLLWCFDGEVHNGGFDQLFFNSLGDHCLEILVGLKRIKANKSAELLEKAMNWFPESIPSSDRQERWKQLGQYEDDEKYKSEMDALDSDFYKYEDNLTELLNTYVRTNREARVKA